MKTTYHLIYLLLSFLFTQGLAGQKTSVGKDSLIVRLQVMPPEGVKAGDNTSQILFERLQQAVTLNGILAEDCPFQLTTQVKQLASEVTPSAPPMYKVELEVTCSIVDNLERHTLQQTTIHLRGIDVTEAKAFRQATLQLQARHPLLKKLIQHGKEKILNLYRNSFESPEVQSPETSVL